jgi:hypothetical protein
MTQEGGVIYLNWDIKARKAFSELFQASHPRVPLEVACTTSGNNAKEPKVYVLHGDGARRCLSVLLSTGSTAQILVVAKKPRGTKRKREVTWLPSGTKMTTLVEKVGKKL